RSHREAAEISAIPDPTLRYSSGVVSPEWMLPKALWLKRHEPAVYARAERLVECTDWMMHRLTGEWTLSLNNVAVKWCHARREGGWGAVLLSRAPEARGGRGGAGVGPRGRGDARLGAGGGGERGRRAGTPVAQGGVDAYLGMLGLGAVAAGDLAMIVGSST